MKQRQTELDLLRFLATLAVIGIHLGRIPYVGLCCKSGFIDISIAPFVACVPVFLMISGRFFLDEKKAITLRTLFRKNIFRLVFTFALWSAVYTACYVWNGTYAGLNIFGILAEWIQGPVHFWYLYATVGLYLLTPLFRKIVQDKTVSLYALVLFAVYNLTTQYLIYLPKVGGILENAVGRLGLESLSGYLGCFLLGYLLYVYQDKITKKWEMTIYLLGAVLMILTYILDVSISEELRSSDFVKQSQKPNVIFYSAAIYLFFVKRVSGWAFSDRIRKLLAKTTEYGFGVYIVHALVIELFKFLPFPAQPMSPALVTVVLTVCGYVVSILLTVLLRKIPKIGKLIA